MSLTSHALRRGIGKVTRCCALSLATIWAVAAGNSVAFSQSLSDPGFESYALSAGQYIKPVAGVWTFVNDAGVVEPFAANSSTGALNTWSATFGPLEGQQYASTYAGSDTIRQLVTFANAGQYEISVYAASPSGTLTIPGVLTSNVVDGEFTFTLGNAAIGATHNVEAGASWSRYAASFDIPAPGNYQLGIRNTLAAVYFVNYDAFAIQAIPEPSAIAMGLVAMLLLAFRVCKPRR
jgi:hypothetical protein